MIISLGRISDMDPKELVFMKDLVAGKFLENYNALVKVISYQDKLFKIQL